MMLEDLQTTLKRSIKATNLSIVYAILLGGLCLQVPSVSSFMVKCGSVRGSGMASVLFPIAAGEYKESDIVLEGFADYGSGLLVLRNLAQRDDCDRRLFYVI